MRAFLTDDTALAAYLYYKGIKIHEGTVENPTHRKRRFFVFDTDPRIKELREEFYNRSGYVVPLEYSEARTLISRYLKFNFSKEKELITDGKITL